MSPMRGRKEEMTRVWL